MKCKKHPYELGAGVCASCLRERLLALIAAQNGLAPHHHSRRCEAPPPPPVAFPRSVSPYLSHRRPVEPGASHCHDLRFFSTPQLGPTFGGKVDGGRNRSSRRFSVFKVLFGHHRSEKADSGSCEGPGTRSWLSELVRGDLRKKKKQQLSPAAEPGRRRPCRAVERGMSPARGDEEADGSGYSSGSPNGWRRSTPTPLRDIFASSHHQQHQRGIGSVSRFAVFLSPLIRVGTSGRRGQVAEAAGFSGHLRSPAHSLHRRRRSPAGGAPHGLGRPRSRKMVDLGRFK